MRLLDGTEMEVNEYGYKHHGFASGTVFPEIKPAIPSFFRGINPHNAPAPGRCGVICGQWSEWVEFSP